MHNKAKFRNEDKKEANKRERKLGDAKMVAEFRELVLQSRPRYNLEWTRNRRGEI